MTRQVSLAQRRAFLLGLRCGRAQMRRELDELALRLHAEVSELAGEMTRRLQAEVAGFTAELRAARAALEASRHRDIEIHKLREQLAIAANVANEIDSERINRAVRVLRAIEKAANERSLIPDELLH